ncbi:MAG TPA: hypothetical protein VFY48_05960 [Solirubrobacterales bacterium]|nr:hypothetical protein [Solirubrobacterales bacterium]
MALAVIAGALVALALPASTSAFWGHHLETLPQDVRLGIAGAIMLQADVGGAECRFPMQARLIAGTSRGRATTSVPTRNSMSCKGLGSYALCQIRALSPEAPSWAFQNTLVQSKELIYDGGEIAVERGIPEEAILIHSRRLLARPKGAFCPATAVSIEPGTVAALPEGGPDTIANVVLNGVLAAKAQAKDDSPASLRMTVSGTLQVADPAQRDTFSIGNRGD